jgi:hypothetical protein
MDKITKFQKILDSHDQGEKIIKHLPTFEFAQKIIELTNAENFEAALIEVQASEEVFAIIKDQINIDEQLWYIEILQKLRNAISSAMNS